MPHISSFDPADLPPPVKDALEQDRQVSRITGLVSSVRKLDGLTNHVYRLSAQNGAFVLRVPRAENVWRIDRIAELHDQLVAARLGVAVKPLHADPERGLMLLPVIDGYGKATPDALGTCLGTLHGSEEPFAAIRQLDLYLDECEAGISGYPELAGKAGPLVAAACKVFSSLPETGLVPCHFDPSPGNLLTHEKGLLLIDFEYAAMAPAGWDLAYASLENGFSKVQENRFLAAYGFACPKGSVPGRLEMAVFKVLCDTVSMLWALGQVKAGNDAADFLELARCYRTRAEAVLAAMP